MTGASSISGDFTHRMDALRAAAPKRVESLADQQRSFAETLAGIQPLGPGAHQMGRNTEREIRESAEQLVSITFVQPILAQLRESNDAAAPFKPTSAEKQFGSLLDAELAHEITRASSFPLVERVASDLLRQAQALGSAGEDRS